jgi:uncharacterized protein (DUF362 family)
MSLAGVGAGALLCPSAARPSDQQMPEPALPLPVQLISPVNYRSTVGLVRGEQRRKIVHDALLAIDAELRPVMRRKKYALIKVNLTSVDVALASTHPDAVHGILDYLAGRFKGPVMIAEAASNDTGVAFENFKYNQVVNEHRSQKVSLLDFNAEAKYVLTQTVSTNFHPTATRIAARLVDPDAFIICLAIPKTHGSMIATAAVKNMSMGAALKSKPKETPVWTDKRKVHVTGYQQHHYNLMLVAQRLAPYWSAAVLDGYEGMEGSGPIGGEAVPSRIAIASKDYVAADRVAVETMGMDAKWVGYLQYCAAVGLGNYDLGKIDVRGETIAAVKKNYKLSPSFDRAIQWMTPLAPAAPQPAPVKKSG